MGCTASIQVNGREPASPLKQPYNHPALNLLVQQGYLLSHEDTCNVPGHAASSADMPVGVIGISVQLFGAFCTALKCHAAHPVVVGDNSDGVEGAQTKPTGQLSTAELCQHVLNPITAARKCRLAEVLTCKFIKPPTYFASHRWASCFLTTADQLLEHITDSDSDAETYLWMDIFAVNQHAFEADLSNLHQAVHNSQATLLCLDSEAFTLTRIWCLYEIWQTILSKSSNALVVLLPVDMDDDSFEEVYKGFSTTKAAATDPEDRQRLLASMQASSTGTEGIDEAIRQGLMSAIKFTADAIIQQLTGDQQTRSETARQHGMLLKKGNTCAWILFLSGSFSEAEALCGPLLSMAEQLYGQDSAEYSATLSMSAMVLRHQKKYKEAEQALSHVVRICRGLLGPDHPGTAASLANLANVLVEQNKYVEAEDIYRQVVQIWHAVLGPKHPDTAASLGNLATVLAAQGKYSEAEQLHREALAIRQEVLGPQHADTATSLNNLADALEGQGKCAEAEQLYEQALEVRLEVLGMEHAETLASLGKLIRIRALLDNPPETE